MPTALMVSPLLLGKQEAWRRFCQKLQESHADEYRAFRRRLGITKAQIWLFQASQADFVVVQLEVEYPQQLLLQLAASEHPFDLWLRRQLQEFHGFDAVQASSGEVSRALISEWQTS
jgi:hypothetical protein